MAEPGSPGATVERRLAAILAADVVGYSSLVERDEAGTLARLKALRIETLEPILARHGGRIAKLMGDGAIVEFSSAGSAVQAAIEAQKAVMAAQAALPAADRIAFRIGLNLGDIQIEPDGDVLGDGVNIAARLETLAEPGGICVSEAVIRGLRAGLPVGIDDLGPKRLKNIQRPVRAYRLRLDGSRRVTFEGRRLPALAAAALLVLLLAGGASVWCWRDTTSAPAGLPLPDRPSIAVLPFDNLSGDERLGRLADGIVEDIISDLSRFRELFVIARNSTFAYKGEPHDIREVGRDLGVRYVLEGTMQAEGVQLRLTAQLIDAPTGAHVWSRRWDRPLGELLVVRDEVTATIAASLASSSGKVLQNEVEAIRRKPVGSLEAYDHYLLGTWQRRASNSEADPAKQSALRRSAVESLTRAVAIDPNLAPAWVSLGWSYLTEVTWERSMPRQQAMDAWRAAAAKAVDLDPNDAYAHVILGLYYRYANEYEITLAQFNRALEVNPNHADALAVIGGNLPFLEPPGRALDLAERALRLNPQYPDRYNYWLRNVHFYAGNFEKAIAIMRSSYAAWDDVLLAVAYTRLRRSEEAREAATEALRYEPDWTAEKEITESGDFAPAAAAARAMWLDGLREAGLPLCAAPEQLTKYPDMKHLPECDAERPKPAAGRS